MARQYQSHHRNYFNELVNNTLQVTILCKNESQKSGQVPMPLGRFQSLGPWQAPEQVVWQQISIAAYINITFDVLALVCVSRMRVNAQVLEHTIRR